MNSYYVDINREKRFSVNNSSPGHRRSTRVDALEQYDNGVNISSSSNNSRFENNFRGRREETVGRLIGEPYSYRPGVVGDGNGNNGSVALLMDSDTIRIRTWMAAAVGLLVFALAAAALGLAIWAVVMSSNNRQRLNEASKGGGLVMRDQPTKMGHTPRWDDTKKAWVAGHGRLSELEDVRLGTKRRPLEDGDFLQWQDGRVVNARDRMLEQELGHHMDTKFGRLANGHIIIRNETSGQWRNVPLAALLSLRSLSDVDLRGPTVGRKSTEVLPTDQSRLEYDSHRGKWVTREPHARAWMRFCVPPGSSDGDSHGRNKTWGQLDPPLTKGRWGRVRPVSPAIGMYVLNIFARGGMRVSRNQVSIKTPPPIRGARPSIGIAYRLQATLSAQNMPPGAWGFLVGAESSPADGGFTTSSSKTNPAIDHWSVDSVRTIAPNQEIYLAYRISTTPPSQVNDEKNLPPSLPPHIQCMHVSVQEL